VGGRHMAIAIQAISSHHRRLWPALMRASGRFPTEHLGKIRQEHTEAGHHLNRIIAFPDWVPPEIAVEAGRLDEKDALQQLGNWVSGGAQ